MTPLIGITSNRHPFHLPGPGPDLYGALSSDDYAGGVEAAGGLPVVIPLLQSERAVEELASRLDGLILSGGDDIDPALYGAEPLAGLGEVEPERDQLELSLTSLFLNSAKPVLAICRGMQVLNVAMGGNVYQDIGREWKGKLQHTQRSPRHHLTHTVSVLSGSRLSALLGGRTSVRTNSFHHQAVRDVAPGLIACAWDSEGLVEGIESPTERFLVGVQWHPENLWRAHPLFLELFRGLVRAAGLQQSD